MTYQHIKSDINDTKCMLQNRQTNTVSPPAPHSSGRFKVVTMMMSIQEDKSSVQVRVFPESPARLLKQNKQDRCVLSLWF